MAANMADTSPGLETARHCSEFRSGNTTKQAATKLADLVVTKFIGFSGLTSAESAGYGNSLSGRGGYVW
jgi:hypothetical protein